MSVDNELERRVPVRVYDNERVRIKWIDARAAYIIERRPKRARLGAHVVAALLFVNNHQARNVGRKETAGDAAHLSKRYTRAWVR